MNNKHILAFIGTIASVMCFSFAMRAQDAQPIVVQLVEKEFPVGDFTALNIANEFEVTLDRGECGVKVTMDDVLVPYVQVYVRAKTLYIAYDAKSVPGDTKKIYKGKNAPVPTFRAIVHIPELTGLTMADDATITSAGTFTADYFQMNLSGKSQVKSININATSASINLTKNAQAVLSMTATDKIDVTDEGNSSLKLSATTKAININGNGSATISVGTECGQVNVNGNGNSRVFVATKASKAFVNASSSSHVQMNGQAAELTIQSDKSAEVEAENLSVKDAIVNMNGSSKATVNASGTIDATLVGGASLTYSGTPVFKIGKIVKSSLVPKGAILK